VFVRDRQCTCATRRHSQKCMYPCCCHTAGALHARRTLTQLRRAAAGEEPALKTIPGLSSSFTCLSRCTSCAVRVTPGVLPTATTRDRFRLLISELLPTLGSPITPAHQHGMRFQAVFTAVPCAATTALKYWLQHKCSTEQLVVDRVCVDHITSAERLVAQAFYIPCSDSI